MFVMVVNFTVRAGTEQQAIEFMRKMEQNTRREPGCQVYIGSQSVEEPRRFCFYEQYTDRAPRDAHRATPYFQEYVANGLAKITEKRSQEFFNTVS